MSVDGPLTGSRPSGGTVSPRTCVSLTAVGTLGCNLEAARGAADDPDDRRDEGPVVGDGNGINTGLRQGRSRCPSRRVRAGAAPRGNELTISSSVTRRRKPRRGLPMVVHNRTVAAAGPNIRRAHAGWTCWELSVTTAGPLPRELTIS